MSSTEAKPRAYAANPAHGLCGTTEREAIRCVVWGNGGVLEVVDGGRPRVIGEGDFVVRVTISGGIVVKCR